MLPGFQTVKVFVLGPKIPLYSLFWAYDMNSDFHKTKKKCSNYDKLLSVGTNWRYSTGLSL